tara:strand:+ start:372 stop:563 length:192 start_codon:yes stop_codon:yes gene_type:complete
MTWKEWIGKKVFIKLKDGSIFSKTIINSYEEGFFFITDKYKQKSTISISQIIKITEDNNDGTE